MTQLNEWHGLNYRRMHEAFAPAHGVDALLVCVGEELGELCGAVLGVTGEKKRKSHKTTEEVLDACADAATYLSLVIFSMGYVDLVDVLTSEREPFLGRGIVPPVPATVRLQELLGGLCFSWRLGNRDAAVSYAARCYLSLTRIAESFGCVNWQKLLGDTFNMVSDRAGWSPRTDLGQRAPVV